MVLYIVVDGVGVIQNNIGLILVVLEGNGEVHDVGTVVRRGGRENSKTYIIKGSDSITFITDERKMGLVSDVIDMTVVGGTYIDITRTSISVDRDSLVLLYYCLYKDNKIRGLFILDGSMYEDFFLQVNGAVGKIDCVKKHVNTNEGDFTKIVV